MKKKNPTASLNLADLFPNYSSYHQGLVVPQVNHAITAGFQTQLSSFTQVPPPEWGIQHQEW